MSTANMKRESKAYSYEDQKWEAEVRQEILKRKRAESVGSTTDVWEQLEKAKLSQKQKVSSKIHIPLDITPTHPQQSIEAQLRVEEDTRQRLSKLSEQLEHSVRLVEALEGGDVILPHVPELCHVICVAFSSHLASGYCQRLWAVMAHAVFKEWTLGKFGTSEVLLIFPSPCCHDNHFL